MRCLMFQLLSETIKIDVDWVVGGEWAMQFNLKAVKVFVAFYIPRSKAVISNTPPH